VIVVPRANGPIVVDGDLEEPGWAGAAHTGPFLAGDAQARPYSDARFTVKDGNLYVALYAADEDIRTTNAKHDDPLYLADAFQLVFHTAKGDRLIDVSARGVVTDGARTSASGPVDFAWESRAKVGVEHDGTPDDPSDQDEEWIVELAVPLEALGVSAGDRVGLSIRRCDDVRGFGRTCSEWRGVLAIP
jgi:hypothetical protein